MLVAHKLKSTNTAPSAFVFSTRTGNAINQRTVGLALRRAQRDAVDNKGRPVFPALHERNADGTPMAVKAGTVPSFHSFRHNVASAAIAAGETPEEVSFQLGHKNSNITRAVYVRQVKTAERTARRRARMEAEYNDLLLLAGGAAG